MVSNCPRCQIVRGVKLSSLHGRCQIVLGVKLSAVSNCPITVCRQAEEEEKPSCGTPQPAAAPTMAGENGQSPPHTRVAVNSLQIFQADKELQSAAENGRASRRYRDHGEGGSGVFCVLLQLYPNSYASTVDETFNQHHDSLSADLSTTRLVHYHKK